MHCYAIMVLYGELSDPCMLRYYGFVWGRACSMVMMAEGAGSNICSQPCPKFWNWKVWCCCWCSWVYELKLMLYRWFEMSIVTSLLFLLFIPIATGTVKNRAQCFFYFILSVKIYFCLDVPVVRVSECKTAKPEPKHNTTNNQNHIHSSSSLSHTQIHHNDPIQKKNKE